MILSFNEFSHEKFSAVIDSHDFAWLTKLSQHIHVAEVIKEAVSKEGEDAECLDGYRWTRRHQMGSNEDGEGKEGKHLLSRSDEDSGDDDDDEAPREKQSVDVWLPPRPPIS